MTTVNAKTKAGRLVAVEVEQSTRPGHVKVMGFEFHAQELLDAIGEHEPSFDTDIMNTIEGAIR